MKEFSDLVKWFIEFTFSGFWYFIGMVILIETISKGIFYAIRAFR